MKSTESKDSQAEEAICLQEQINKMIQVLDKASTEKDHFKCQINMLNHRVTELENEKDGYRNELQSLSQVAQSNLTVIFERDSLKDQLIVSCNNFNQVCVSRDQLLKEKDHLLERIAQLEDQVSFEPDWTFIRLKLNRIIKKSTQSI